MKRETSLSLRHSAQPSNAAPQAIEEGNIKGTFALIIVGATAHHFAPLSQIQQGLYK